jgi:diguanylate cyclase (GGDEF)-like protein/PAS domain S-box-containing protein
MLPGLLVNLAIISLFLFLQWKFIIEIRKINSSNYIINLFIGLTSGLIGVLLMIHRISVTDYILLDFRPVIISLTALFGSPFSTFICVAIIGTMGVVLYGFSASSIVLFIVTVLIGILFVYVGTIKKNKILNFLTMTFISVLYIAWSLLYAAGVNRISVYTYIYLILSYLVIAAFSYCQCEYIRTSHENYKRLSYYELMINNSTDLIISFDSKGLIKYLSPSVVNLLGYKPLDVVGTKVYDFLHPEDIDYIKEQHEHVIKVSKTVISEVRVRKKDGNYLWFESSAHCIKDSKGTIKEILSVSRDITVRKVMEKQLKEANIKLTEANEKLKELSFTDSLTGISNRRYFETCLKRDWRRTQRTFKPLSLLMIDIDYFKIYNDTYGHLQGDECLKIVAQTFKDTIKRGGDLVARLGGEEFVVILPDTDEIGATKVANNLRASIEGLKIPNKLSEVMPYITISVGIASIVPSISNKYHDLIHCADTALYNAKNKGRNRVEVYKNTLISNHCKYTLSQ